MILAFDLYLVWVTRATSLLCIEYLSYFSKMVIIMTLNTIECSETDCVTLSLLPPSISKLYCFNPWYPPRSDNQGDWMFIWLQQDNYGSIDIFPRLELTNRRAETFEHGGEF